MRNGSLLVVCSSVQGIVFFDFEKNETLAQINSLKDLIGSLKVNSEETIGYALSAS